MKRLAAVLGAVLFAALLPFVDAQQPAPPKPEITKVPIGQTGKTATFIDRDRMRPLNQYKRAVLPGSQRAVPTTSLPVDASGGRKVVMPMHANDRYGICGMAMAAHTIEMLTYRQGKATQYVYDDAPLIKHYFALSGGDNGMSQDMEIGRNGCFTTGVGYKKDAIAVGAMNIDPNDVQLVQYCLDQFYALHLGWAVPDAFINNFSSGQSYLQPMRPNPRNGHYTTITDVTAEGYYTLWTWGGWAQVSQSFVASVMPDYFVCFCPLQFDLKTGYDSKGRHITRQAATWVAMGGDVIPASVIAQFPPATGPIDPPPDLPPSPTNSITFTIPGYQIPGQTITFSGPFGRTYTGKTTPYNVPPQTITAPLPAPK